MELQVRKGIFTTRKDVVLHHDVEVHAKGGYSFTSTICEETTENGIDPILLPDRDWETSFSNL